MGYGARRRLLEVAADFDDSNGLRTALRMLDAHPFPLHIAAALLGVGQAACIAAAANYGTGTPLALRAKTAGCWARWGCGYSVPHPVLSPWGHHGLELLLAVPDKPAGQWARRGCFDITQHFITCACPVVVIRPFLAFISRS